MRETHILVINPNSTASMTHKIAAAARAAAGPLSRITAINPLTGPAAIQGPEDGAAALPGLFDLVERSLKTDPSVSAMIIRGVACFGISGSPPARQRRGRRWWFWVSCALETAVKSLGALVA